MLLSSAARALCRSGTRTLSTVQIACTSNNQFKLNGDWDAIAKELEFIAQEPSPGLSKLGDEAETDFLSSGPFLAAGKNGEYINTFEIVGAEVSRFFHLLQTRITLKTTYNFHFNSLLRPGPLPKQNINMERKPTNRPTQVNCPAAIHLLHNYADHQTLAKMICVSAYRY